MDNALRVDFNFRNTGLAICPVCLQESVVGFFPTVGMFCCSLCLMEIMNMSKEEYQVKADLPTYIIPPMSDNENDDIPFVSVAPFSLLSRKPEPFIHENGQPLYVQAIGGADSTYYRVDVSGMKYLPFEFLWTVNLPVFLKIKNGPSFALPMGCLNSSEGYHSITILYKGMSSPVRMSLIYGNLIYDDEGRLSSTIRSICPDCGEFVTVTGTAARHSRDKREVSMHFNNYYESQGRVDNIHMLFYLSGYSDISVTYAKNEEAYRQISEDVTEGLSAMCKRVIETGNIFSYKVPVAYYSIGYNRVPFAKVIILSREIEEAFIEPVCGSCASSRKMYGKETEKRSCHLCNRHYNATKDDGILICKSCQNSVQSHRANIMAYGKKKRLSRKKNPLTIPMGVELEVAFSRTEEKALVMDTISSNDTNVIFKHDGSIPMERGFEAVSIPLLFDEHSDLYAWKTIFNSEYLEDNARCGMHVHVPKTALGAVYGDPEKMILPFYSPANRKFMRAVASRESSNPYAPFDGAIYRSFPRLPYGDRYFTNPVVAINTKALLKTRYVGLNFKTKRKATVEFRIFASPTDMVTFRRNLQFVDAFTSFYRNYGENLSVNVIEDTDFRKNGFYSFILDNKDKYNYVAPLAVIHSA